jgi:hypothetical protein
VTFEATAALKMGVAALAAAVENAATFLAAARRERR